jgi:uncharacterized phage protein (TIGR02218 family)
VERGYSSALDGFVGKITPQGDVFKAEVKSQVSLLEQQIGDVIQVTNRRRRLDEVVDDISPYTHAAEVTNVIDQRTFEVDVSQADHYFRYGLVEWVTGNNANLEAEIKDNDGIQITLQKGATGLIQEGDTLNLIMGYDGSIESTSALGDEAVEAFDAEPFSPNSDKPFNYPQ